MFSPARILPVLSLLFIVFSPHSYAQEAGGITLAPAFEEIVISRGSSEQREIVITNNGDESITLDLFAIDFKQQGEFGEIAFLGRDTESYSYSLASFISLEADSATIEPGTNEEITVTIQDREGLSPGGHYGAVVARLQQEEMEGNAVVSPSVSSLLLVRKEGGERFNLNLLDHNWPDGIVYSYPSNTTLTFSNEGNIHLIPYGTFKIVDILGRELYSGVINPSSHIILPEVRRTIRVDVKKINESLPISFNEIVIQGNDSLQETSYTYRGSFIYVHPFVPGGLVLIIILLLFLRRKSKRKNKKKQ